MTILNTIPAVVRCDGCAAEGMPDDQARSRATGALTWAFLPARWLTLFIGGVQVHLCPDCVAAHPDPFGDRKPAFMARLERHGLHRLAEIIDSVGVPEGIGRQWAEEWINLPRSVM